jgi:hypothetical protein
MNQVLNHILIKELEFKQPIIVFDSDLKDTIQTMSYRYDQLEARDNSEFTKRLFGMDLLDQCVQAFKTESLTNMDKMKVAKFNP